MVASATKERTEPILLERESVTPESLRDRNATVVQAIEQLSSNLDDLAAGHTVTEYDGYDLARSARKLREKRLGTRRVEFDVGAKHLWAATSQAGLDVISLAMHLADPREQAAVLRRFVNAAQGALMQLAVDAYDRAKIEQAAAEEDPDRPGYAVIDPGAVASDIISADQRMSAGAAGKFFLESLAIYERLPRVWNQITDGEMPKWVGDIIARETRHVTDPVRLAAIEEAMLKRLCRSRGNAQWSGRQTRILRDLVAQFDPDALTKKADEEERQRDVTIREDEPGMSALQAALPILDAEAIMASVNALAERWARHPSETRKVNERRADALVQLVTGMDKNPPGFDPGGDGANAQPKIVVQPRVTLLAGSRTLPEAQRIWTASTSTMRAKLDAFLQQCATAQIDTMPIDSPECDLDPANLIKAITEISQRIEAETTYEPSAAVRRAVIERDGTCRHPGCMVPAERCDIDHVIPFNHDNPLAGGLTREDNLQALCRRHHRQKTHGSFGYKMHSDGRVSARIGDECYAESEPHGLRGLLRREQGRLYGADPATYVAQLQRLVEAAFSLHAALQRVAQNAQSWADREPAAQPAAQPTAQPTARQRRAKETEKHRAETAERIRTEGLAAVRGEFEDLTKGERRAMEKGIQPSIQLIKEGDLPEDPPF